VFQDHFLVTPDSSEKRTEVENQTQLKAAVRNRKTGLSRNPPGNRTLRAAETGLNNRVELTKWNTTE